MHLGHKLIRNTTAALLGTLAALILAAVPAGIRAQQPAIGVAPPAASMEVGQTLTISVQIDTGGAGVRGGAAVLMFDPNVFQVAGSVQIDPVSVYQLTPPPVMKNGAVEIPFLAPSFEQVPYVGGIAFVQFVAIGPSEGTTIGLGPLSRFSPQNGAPNLLVGQYVVTGEAATPTPAEQTPEENTPDNTPEPDPQTENTPVQNTTTGGIAGVNGMPATNGTTANHPEGGKGTTGSTASGTKPGSKPGAPSGGPPQGSAAIAPGGKAPAGSTSNHPDSKPEGGSSTGAAPGGAPATTDASAAPAAGQPTAADTQIASLPPETVHTPDLASEFERRWSPGLVKRLAGKFNWSIYE